MKLHRQESHPDNLTVLPRPLTLLENPLSRHAHGSSPLLTQPPHPTRGARPALPRPAPPLPPPPPLPLASLRAGADLLPRVSTLLLEPEGAALSRSARCLRCGHPVPHRSVASSRCLQTARAWGPAIRTLPATHRIPKLPWTSAGLTCLCPSPSGVLSPTSELHPSAFSLRRPRRPGGRPVCLGQVRNHKGPRCLPLLMHPRVRPLHGARTQYQGGLRTEQNLRSQEPRAGREGGKTQRGQARLGGLQLDAGGWRTVGRSSGLRIWIC